jgi:molybdopterin converting factor small subunit
MRVTVHLHTILQRQTPEGMLRRLELSLPPASTLGDLLRRLEIVVQGDAILLVVNGKQVEASHTLADGDEIHLIPALSGGAPCRRGTV